MSPAPDSTLADRRRSNADLQRELAELRRRLDECASERDEALQRETAAAEVLQAINSSPGDLAPVFDAMLERAMALCSAEYGHIYTFDGQQFHAVAIKGQTEFVSWRRQRGAIRPEGDGSSPLERLIAGERALQVADVWDEQAYRTHPRFRELVDTSGIRSIAAAALHKEGSLLGAIIVYRQEVRPFSDKQIALLQNFAAQAVIAMENARLITETREALEQQTATAEVLGVINSSPGDLAPVFDAMLEKAMRLCEADCGQLAIFDGEFFRFVAAKGDANVITQLLALPPTPPSQGLTWPSQARGANIVHISNIRDEDAYRLGSEAAREFWDAAGARTLLSVSLRKEEVLLGTITVYRRVVRPFGEKQIALLQNFAAQAVIAMENARLITETREALEQQTATAEVLGVINSSPGDLAPVFDAILEKAHTLCGASKGSLVIIEGEQFRTVATRGLSEQYAAILREAQHNPPGSVPDRLLKGEDLVHIADASQSDFPVPRAAAELEGARTIVYVPLRKDSTLLGYITAYRQEVRPFSEKHIALLQNFAAQAVIAMENARLLGELRERNDEIAGWNRELETRVADQLAELERTGKLRRFLAPQLADLIIAQGDESILESHRREIVVVFCDIRGFTAFAERAEPEEVMALLRDYHAALGPIVARFEGTLDHYSGDGVMVFFNDPLPTPEPAKRAIEMAAAMREAAQQVLKTWRRHGHDLGFGVGISQGYATLGQIGFAERMDYTAIGTVCNLAARLCDEAKDGQILISRRVAVAVEDDAKLEEIGEVSLKGLSQAVAVYNVVQ